jgi:uncharacterized protein YndB with AHSA1/START domain
MSSNNKTGRVASRRQVITGLSLGAGAAALRTADSWADAGQEITRAMESIHQEVSFKASPERLYAALTEARQFEKVIQLSAAAQSGMIKAAGPPEISSQAGGAFTVFGGHIVGRQIELVPGVRIVQAWRTVDWEPGVFSIARFELAKQGAGTRLVFDHTGFPKGQAEHLAQGWTGNYWEPLAKFLA